MPLALALGLGAGCGLVSSDIASVTLDLPTKKYSFDTASAGFKAPPGNLPAVACGPSELVTDCCSPAPGITIDCNATPLVCEAGFCTYHTTFEVVSKVDLGMEAPQYKQFSGQSLLNLSLTKVSYTAVNGLNVASPPIDIYLAPDGAMHISEGQKFGTVDAVPAGATVSGTVKQAPGAAAAFGKYAKDWATPFTFIGAAAITVKGGEPAPMGKIEVTVSGTAKISPNL